LAFPEHEWTRSGCHRDGFVPTPTFGLPVWKGDREPVRLLVNADFGMGDTLQFYRFIEEAKERVAGLHLLCDEDFGGLFECVSEPPECDKVINMMCLPGVLGVKAVYGKPYLKADPVRLGGFNVGTCWAGNPFNGRDAVRSAPEGLDVTLPPGPNYLSLDKLYGPRPGEADCRPMMKDWKATASLVAGMDLVVSVDTAVAHLAGALGVPVWNVVSVTDPDWRWGREGDSTPWYDSMTVIRNRDWAETISEVKRRIRKLSA